MSKEEKWKGGKKKWQVKNEREGIELMRTRVERSREKISLKMENNIKQREFLDYNLIYILIRLILLKVED